MHNCSITKVTFNKQQQELYFSIQVFFLNCFFYYLLIISANSKVSNVVTLNVYDILLSDMHVSIRPSMNFDRWREERQKSIADYTRVKVGCRTARAECVLKSNKLLRELISCNDNALGNIYMRS